MDTKDEGCCGFPPRCAFSKVNGRCQAREEFEARIEEGREKKRQQGMELRERLIEKLGLEAVLEAEAEERERLDQKERDRELGLDRDRGGRTLTR